jgi:hypothetical protein
MLDTRLTICALCESLATIEERRPVYRDGQTKPSDASSRFSHYEEDVNCPYCGYRTQNVKPDLQFA